jgi:hypothetical protein
MKPASPGPEKPVVIKQYAIHRDLFTTGFERNGGPCNCTSSCCSHGVLADIAERERILAHREMIANYMDSTQATDSARWFDNDEHDDPDFPSGRCAGTAIVNGKCAFLDGLGRCTLQRAADEEGMDRWLFKPMFCVLFPIEISNGVVGFDPLLKDEELCCSPRAPFDTPLFEACRDELTYLLGSDGYQSMEDAYARMFAGSARRKTA